MATIRQRRQANGAIRYTAVVRLRKGQVLLHQGYKTFKLLAAAQSWARRREVELENPAHLARRQHEPVTFGELVRWYIDSFESVSRWQRSKQTHLQYLERHPLGQVNALSLTTAALIDHVRTRRADGTGPSTVLNDLVWIGYGRWDVGNDTLGSIPRSSRWPRSALLGLGFTQPPPHLPRAIGHDNLKGHGHR